jgi:hypothetical protein
VIVTHAGLRWTPSEESFEESGDVWIEQRPPFVERYRQDGVSDIIADARKCDEAPLRTRNSPAVALDDLIR